MTTTFEELVQDYLKDKKITNPTPQQLSKAESYSYCYLWYIEEMKVLPDTAAMSSDVWVNKYALQSSEGTILEQTPVDTWKREATALANEEIRTNPDNKDFDHWFSVFYSALEGWKYSPQGSGIYALGNPYVKASVSNCFVAPSPKDNLESIFDTGKYMARTYASRGGVGINLNGLRPHGALTNNAAKTSTGAASFMDFYSYITGMIGQCIAEDQKVLTSVGLKPIKDVVSGDLIWTRKGWVKNLNTLFNGVRPTYKITTKRGLELTATADHTLVSVENCNLVERQLGEFKVGDTIVSIPGSGNQLATYVPLNDNLVYEVGHGADNRGNRLNTEVAIPPSLTEDLAYFVGYSFGDGYVSYDKFQEPYSLSLACAHSHPKIETKLKSIANNLFGYQMSSRKGDGAVNKVTLSSKLLCLFLKNNGLLKQNHKQLIMPEVLWKSKTSVQLAFVAGYLDADGYVSGKKKGYTISSVNLSMLKAIQQQLMGAGIVGKIHLELRQGKQGTENWCDLYTLCITGKAFKDKVRSLLSLSIKVSEEHSESKRDGCLTPFSDVTLGIRPESHLLNYIPSHPQKISANAYIKLSKTRELDNLLIIDEVKTIEEAGELPVYDLQLESEHLFYCQGLLVHNCGRRGALMMCMSIHHPDIIRFIEMKSDIPLQPFFEELLGVGVDINDWRYSAIADRLKSTSFANVSVMLSDEFMAAVKNKENYEQRFTFLDEKYAPISIMVNAEEVWNKLMFSAWKSAEPGILFWDLVSRESTSDYYGKMPSFNFIDPMTGEGVTLNDLNFAVSATNPCGEQPLPEDDSCCLGTHYLVAFVKNAWTDEAEFDFEEYERVLRIAVRAQDNIKGIDAASLSIQSQRAMALLLRRIGLGNTGLSDCMASLGICYDTEDAVEFVTKLYTFLRDTTYDESVRLAQEKGAFIAFDWEKHKNSPYIQRLPKPIQNNIKKYGIRNVALLTQAPNGSMSILMRNCSSGSEPMFLLASTRNMKVPGTGGDVVQYTLYHQAVQDALNAGWSKERVAEVFVAAGEVDPRTRVKMQGVMQKFIDSAISITTNLKSTATVQEVRDLYEMAHEYGCKGFTVYRDGCRTGVLNAIKEDGEGINKKVARPKSTSVDIHKTRYKDKNYMILVGKTEGKAIEIFGGEEAGLSLPTQYHSATLTKKSRGHYTLVVQLSEDEEDQLKVNNIGNRFPAQDVMTLTRMISLSLRNGISVGDIVDQLTKASSALYDAPAVFARVLKQYIPDEEVILREKAKGKVCPECGEPLDFRRESGCLVELCSSCSFSNSKCG